MSHDEIVAALRDDRERHCDTYAQREAYRRKLAAGYDLGGGAEVLRDRAPDAHRIPGAPRFA